MGPTTLRFALVVVALSFSTACISTYDTASPEFDECPREIETCDGIDNDCDGEVDELCDKDGDGYCDMYIVTTPVDGEWPAVCPMGAGDCVDTNDQVYPGATEICDDVNNACAGPDAPVDLGCDDDGDGYCDGDMSVGEYHSVCPLGGGDCEDSDGSTFPGSGC